MLYLHDDLVANDEIGPVRIFNYEIVVPYWKERLDGYVKPLLAQVVSETGNVRRFKEPRTECAVHLHGRSDY